MSNEAVTSNPDRQSRLYRMLWRWHFYAGLFCIPFVIVLAISGSLYLFRPQIEDFIDRDLLRLERTGAPATQDELVAAAIASVPGSKLASIVLPEHPNQAARVLVSVEGDRTRVYLHPDTRQVLKSVKEDSRFRRVVFNLHGELLMGTPGTILVELAACWAIVMVITGLYLWWPRNARGLAGVLWPRLREGPQRFWRDLHAVTGVWVSVFALFLLVSGLPWALVWGEGLKQVRNWAGANPVAMDWATSSASEHAEHRAHDHDLMAARASDLSIEAMVEKAAALQIAPPVMLSPPTQKSPYWSANSDSGNRTVRSTVLLDPSTGAVAARQDFSDKHVIDQVVGFGVSAHEGQLFGPLNQALGLLTALGLILLSVSAFVLWRRRAPAGVLGAPPPVPDSRVGAGLGALILLFAILLPVLGACVLLIALIEWGVLKRIPAARRWLGLAT